MKGHNFVSSVRPGELVFSVEERELEPLVLATRPLSSLHGREGEMQICDREPEPRTHPYRPRKVHGSW